ncbi:MAG: tRNA (N6-isopentenyl adenosine(37)-C2)-methylthiotransferase MiaB, partial [Clostridia bacterium]|nr:tRNA (N6-isopentenyl adenosine(37)-C2)-methylthiotransferase MiaB [Clostridia bacterium]
MQIHLPAVTETDQRIYADRVAALLPTLYGETPLACVVTYGCQQNVSDSERFKGQLTAMGYRLTEDRQAAHLVLFNTCAVREHAEDRVYGNIGRTKAMKEKDRNRLVVVCGCMAQRESVAEKIRRSYPYVDIVFGTQVQHRLAEFVYRRLTAHERVFEREMDNGEIPEEVPVCRDGGPKGWLPIMYGCNNFCTYCIVPYARGRERSREPDRILAEAKEMLAAGYRDITLLGQNVNSYGKGAAHGVNFAELLRRLNALDGEFILRFMTSHPKDCTKELIDTIRDCEKVSHHLHLPFQSGSDRILKRMNRQYDREKYLELIAYAKEQIPDLSLTSDVIVGFPGETYED